MAVSRVRCALRQAMTVEQPANGSRTKQRRVSIEDEHVAIEAGQRFGGLQNGVAGAEFLTLGDVVELRSQMRLHFILAVSHHNMDVFRLDYLQRVFQNAFENAAVT